MKKKIRIEIKSAKGGGFSAEVCIDKNCGFSEAKTLQGIFAGITDVVKIIRKHKIPNL